MNCVTEKGKILLVEDCIINALHVINTMKNAGYETVHCLTGEEAVGMVESGSRFNFILMDVELGEGISGITAAVRILNICRMPVIFLTSYSMDEISSRMDGYTGYGYISKQDFSSRVVLAMVDTMACSSLNKNE